MHAKTNAARLAPRGIFYSADRSARLLVRARHAWRTSFKKLSKLTTDVAEITTAQLKECGPVPDRVR
jgi:hypothetical protein